MEVEPPLLLEESSLPSDRAIHFQRVVVALPSSGIREVLLSQQFSPAGVNFKPFRMDSTAT